MGGVVYFPFHRELIDLRSAAWLIVVRVRANQDEQAQ